MSADTDLMDGVTRLLQEHRERCKCGAQIAVTSTKRDGPHMGLLFAALNLANAVDADFRRSSPETVQAIYLAWEKFKSIA